MQVQLVSTDTEGFCPMYAGQGQWTLPGLSGRTVGTDVAIASMTAAAALVTQPEAGDSDWRALYAVAQALGLTARQFADAIGAANSAIPALPRETPRSRRRWPRP